MTIHKKDIMLYLNPLYLEDKEAKYKFNQWYEASKIVQIRAITILTAFLYILYSQINNAIAPSEIKPIIMLLHLYALPLCLFFISGLTFFSRYYRAMIFLLSVVPIAAAIGSLFIIANLNEFTIYLPELYLIVIWVFAISGLRLKYATISASTIFLISTLSGYYFSFPKDLLLMHFSWLFSAFSFGILTAFIIEKSNKLFFLKTQQLERVAITDGLTGLYNRLRIESSINEEIERAERYKSIFSLILLDIDYFKSVNDIHGHHVGDIVLKEFSSIIKNGVRKVDAVGRWGGEEFIIVLPETDIKEAKNIAEQIRIEIENHIFTAVKLKTSSFGVSEYLQDDTVQSIINRADKALYKAKESGRNQIQSS